MTNLRRVRARALTGNLPPEEMPAWAATLLAQGVDSPSLRTLAGLSPRAARAAHDTFDDAMDELGAPTLTLTEARWELARKWAEAVLDGSTHPYEAARALWALWNELDRPIELDPFVTAASEWEDDHEHRQEHERDVINAARHLLGTG